MHEMSLCESVRQIMEDQAEAQSFGRVKRVWLEVGKLSGVEIEALRFGFDVVMRGSIADGAGLEIIEVPGQAWCLACGKTVTIGQRYDPCPECGGYQLQVTDGTEMRVKELEVD